MRILVTGSRGFIGRSLIPILKARGHKVFALSREDGDIANPKLWLDKVKKFKPETAIHLAWEEVSNWSRSTTEVGFRNVRNSLTLMSNLGDLGLKKFIGMGSVVELSGNNTPFIASKISFRMFGQSIAKEKKMQFIWARLFHLYGPNKWASLFPYVIDSINRGEVLEIRTPLLKHDFIYVDDVAEGLALIAERSQKEYEVYELGTGKKVVVQDMISNIYKHKGLGDSYKKTLGKVSEQENDPVADLASISKDIGWKPRIDASKGVRMMLTKEATNEKSRK